LPRGVFGTERPPPRLTVICVKPKVCPTAAPLPLRPTNGSAVPLKAPAKVLADTTEAPFIVLNVLSDVIEAPAATIEVPPAAIKVPDAAFDQPARRSSWDPTVYTKYDMTACAGKWPRYHRVVVRLSACQLYGTAAQCCMLLPTYDRRHACCRRCTVPGRRPSSFGCCWAGTRPRNETPKKPTQKLVTYKPFPTSPKEATKKPANKPAKKPSKPTKKPSKPAKKPTNKPTEKPSKKPTKKPSKPVKKPSKPAKTPSKKPGDAKNQKNKDNNKNSNNPAKKPSKKPNNAKNKKSSKPNQSKKPAKKSSKKNSKK